MFHLGKPTCRVQIPSLAVKTEAGGAFVTTNDNGSKAFQKPQLCSHMCWAKKDRFYIFGKAWECQPRAKPKKKRSKHRAGGDLISGQKREASSK